jgi:hypothetical protein
MNKWVDYFTARNPTTAQSATSSHLSLYDVPPVCVGLNIAVLREVSNEGERLHYDRDFNPNFKVILVST